MEEKDFTKESNLPEEGAAEVTNSNLEVNDPVIESVVDEVQESSIPEETVEEKENVSQVTDELVVEEAAVEPIVEEVKEEPVAEETKVVVEATVKASEVKVEETKDQADLSKEDLSVLTRVELLTKLNGLINSHHVEEIREVVEEIKLVFYKSYKAEYTEALTKFIEEGGKQEDFKFQDDSSEDTFKELYGLYRSKKSEHGRKIEAGKKENLRLKYEIVEGIKELINKEESINKTFQEFREYQNKWREIGLVPQSDVKNLWETYHHTVEKFYDFININKELRDLDLKKNLEEKIKLCEKAEGLLIEDSITKAFKILQDYHNSWREIGPVPRDQKDDIWDRFKAITTQINKKHQEYFEGLKEQQVGNLEQKIALCDKVDELLNAEYLKPKDWEEKANELIELQKLWRTIGFAPKKDNNKVYYRFKTSCDAFFSKKREYYKETKDIQKNNLQAKLDLCIQAEALKDSTEWKKTTEDFIKLQKRWKEIGPVPRKQSDSLWKRFRGTCDFYFNTKDEFYNTVDSRQEDNLKAKLAIIEKVKVFEKGADDKETLNQLMAIQKDWSDIGYVPINSKEEIQKQFRDVINEQFEKLNIEDKERKELNFKTKVDSWVNTNSKGKLYAERNKLVIKIKEQENEIALYENNIGFFSSSKGSSKMIDDIQRKIVQAKERMDSLKAKLRMLDRAEDEN